MLLQPQQTRAADASLEKEIHLHLENCLRLANIAIDKCSAGKTCNGEISEIQSIGNELKASQLLINEGFNEREKISGGLGANGH